MKRLIIKAILKILTESIFFSTGIGVIIGIIGYVNQWNSPVAYSNAFFMAACLAIIAGASSRFAAAQDIINSRTLYAESFRTMSSGDRANYIVNANSSIRTVILGFLTGLWLILVSAIAASLS